MKKILSALLYLPMVLIGIFYSIYFAIPGDSDTIPFASMLIGIILVAIPMLALCVCNVMMFVIFTRHKKVSKRIRKFIIIGGMLTSIWSFLWLFLISSFTVYVVTGVYALAALVLGGVLLGMEKGN